MSSPPDPKTLAEELAAELKAAGPSKATLTAKALEEKCNADLDWLFQALHEMNAVVKRTQAEAIIHRNGFMPNAEKQHVQIGIHIGTVGRSTTLSMIWSHAGVQGWPVNGQLGEPGVFYPCDQYEGLGQWVKRQILEFLSN